jgi:predicted nucleic acid-binding protein
LQLTQAAAPIQRLFRKYRDRQMDLADACLVHLAGEFETGDILTFDSDFEIYRWGPNKPFHLLPKNQAR